MINKVILVGNIGSDLEIRYTKNNLPVTNGRLATNESYKDRHGDWQQKTEWHKFVVWGDKALAAVEKIKMGYLVYIEGSLQTTKYTRSDGAEVSQTEVSVKLWRILNNNQRKSNTKESKTNIYETYETVEGNNVEDDEDVPF